MNGPEKFEIETADNLEAFEDIGESIDIPDHLIDASSMDDRLPEQRIEAYGDDPENYEKANPSASVPTDDGTTGQISDDDVDYSYLEP